MKRKDEDQNEVRIERRDKFWIAVVAAILIAFLIFVVVYGLDFLGI